MSDSNQVSHIYVPETTHKITPVNSALWKAFAFTGDSWVPNYTTQEDETIDPSNLTQDVVQVSASASGDVNFNLRAMQIDDLIAAVMGGTWVDDEITFGALRPSFSWQKSFNDLESGNKHELATGVRMSQLLLDLTYGQIAKGTLSLMAAGWADQANSAVGTGSVIAAPAVDVLNGTTDVISVKVDGAESGLFFKSLKLTLGAGVREKTAIKNLFAFNHGYGTRRVELAAECYFDSRVIENKFRNNTPMALSFAISDGANSYEFELPHAKSTQRQGLSQTQRDTDIMSTYTILGTKDPVTGTSCNVTRVLEA